MAEFLVLADGTRIELHNERGFGSMASTGSCSESMTSEMIRASVLTTVLPDGDDGEEHPWEWLAHLAASKGVNTTAEEMRQLPYVVELSQRLQRVLARVDATGSPADEASPVADRPAATAALGRPHPRPAEP